MPSTALGERPRRKERWRAPLKTSGTRDSSTSIMAIGTFRAVVLSIMTAVGLASVVMRARTLELMIDIERFVLALRTGASGDANTISGQFTTQNTSVHTISIEELRVV